MVVCPICEKPVKSSDINPHLDSSCRSFVIHEGGAGANGNGANGTQAGAQTTSSSPPADTQNAAVPSTQKRSASSFFQTPAKRQATSSNVLTPVANEASHGLPRGGKSTTTTTTTTTNGVKRSFDEGPGRHSSPPTNGEHGTSGAAPEPAPQAKRTKTNRAAPLAERMRPSSLDDVWGQDLVGPSGVLRALIEADRVPSMILWGGSGTGKTTIARCIARAVGSRFIELNATSSGVAECKKLFGEAASELALTGRRTIIFCDEIHRFSKAQQDVFLKPVEAGTITLVGATTENPSFRVQNALLSRCRTFTLARLGQADVQRILVRALGEERAGRDPEMRPPPPPPSPLIDDELLAYLSAFADGDARTALNLLELALSLTAKAEQDGTALTKADIKASLTKTLVYDRAGDQHYDTISAFHKAVRGSDADAALYYLARMLQSGEDPLFVARRMVVIASEDVGLADSTLLPLATAAYTAAQQIGMPEARIPLAHCAVALALAPKSTRAYRGLNNAYAALREPGVAGLPIPIHLRNAPTRLMKELGYGREYKYNPNYKDGQVRQDYLPEELLGRTFLEDRDLGTEIDPDLEMTEAS